MMGMIRVVFLVAVLGLSHCFSIDKTKLIDAIDRQDFSEVSNFFESVESISWGEAQELIADVYEYYASQYGIEIFENDEFIENLEHWKEVYHWILEENGFSSENILIQNKDPDSFSIILCGKKNKRGVEAEVPGSMILGGVEILGGSLVWILPIPGAKLVGGAMISDGIRRTFNGLEELDNENKQNGEMNSSK
ncbi:MAG: hypothetical protein P0S96_04230 [Simkaniaceae bacterium]|nr:hypothetical protein [Candidatus Sacchlamyda saccharinae]